MNAKYLRSSKIVKSRKKYYCYSNIGKSFDFVHSCESDCSLAAGMIMKLCLTFKIVHMMLLKLLVIAFSFFDVSRD